MRKETCSLEPGTDGLFGAGSSFFVVAAYVAVYRSLLKQPSISEFETTVPMPRPVLENKLNGQGLTGVERTALPTRIL